MVPNVRNLARYKRQLAVSLGLLIVMVLFPYPARANPFVGDTCSISSLYNPIWYPFAPLELFLAFLLTAVIEVPTVLLAGKYLFRFGGLRARWWLEVGLGANLITLPCAWFVVPWLFVMVTTDFRLVGHRLMGYWPEVHPLVVNSASYWLIVAIVEGVVVLIEAEIYHRFVFIGRQHALALSLVANALSFGAGLVLF
jgi:hypothetical protein